MIAGIGVIVALVAFIEWVRSFFLDKTNLPEDAKDLTVALAEACVATAMQAGFMLPAAYVFSRSLFLPIFIHMGWDFAEPGIFGAINPSTSISQGLFASKVSGSVFLTGGQTGPQTSLQALILCLLTG